jgi:hypothetical protein
MTAAEEILRGETALAIMAFLSWAEMYRGGARVVLDGAISSWVTVGRPADLQIARALDHTRAALGRYLASGAKVPAWLPESIIALLKEHTRKPETKGT